MVLHRLGKQDDATSWAEGLKAHEHAKRRFCHEGLLKGPQARMDQGAILRQERMFDPLLQRFRDNGAEMKQQAFEEKERIGHLNRALDVQIMREQKMNILSQESRTAAIEKKSTPRAGTQDVNTMSMPSSMIDYNLISNLPCDKHHWAKPEERPRHVCREPKPRVVQSAQLRDFNIVTNRYLEDHQDKGARDTQLNRLEVAHKYHQQCFFDPVMQKYNELDVEERARVCDDARDAEVCMRGQMNQPPSYLGRVSAHYDLVTHQAGDDGAQSLKSLDASEAERKAHYKPRYMNEHLKRMNDIVLEDSAAVQRHDFVAHERWEETTGRGYNIVTNRGYGHGEKFEKPHEPFTVPRLTTWEKVLQDRCGPTPPPSADRGGISGIADQGASADTVRSARSSASARSPGGGAARQASASGTPRARATPRTLSEAGSASLGSTRGRPPVIAPAGPPSLVGSAAPPPPPIPGSPVGSVYSRPKV